MKKQAVGVVSVLVLVLCAISSCTTSNEKAPNWSRGTRESDARAVKTALDQWVQLYNARQFHKLISTLYADDAVPLAPGTPICKGRDAILLRYTKAEKANEEHVDTTVVEDLRISGDLAVARGSDTGTTKPMSAGPTEKYSLKWLMVMKRQADGTWQFIYEMWNEDGAPQG
ncbi:MAG: DUF4440 domain-containing protein [Planctomycetota bacterium]